MVFSLSRLLSLVLAFSVATVAPCAVTAADSTVEIAEFRVTQDVLNSGMRPFTATLGRIGNGAWLTREGGFEPLVFRTMFLATGGARDRVDATFRNLSYYDTWKSGVFDGAEVEILRIENGRFVSVRTDRVAIGGHVAAEWIELDRNEAVAPDVTRYQFTWDDYNRTGVPYYFTVRAIDGRGRLSPPATSAQVVKPEAAKKVEVRNDLIKRPSIRGGDGDLPAPGNLRATLTAENTVELRWDPVRGAKGYLVYRADEPPERLRGSYLRLEGEGPPPQDGDLVILRTSFYDAKADRLLTNRVWRAGAPRSMFTPSIVPDFSDRPKGGQWRLIRHEPGTPVPEPGETHLRVTLRPGESFMFGLPNHSGLDQSWYEVLRPGETYRAEVWVRSDRPVKGQIRFRGFYGGKDANRIGPMTFTAGPEWRQVVFEFRPPAVDPGRKPNRMEVVVEGPGQVDFDNFRIYRTAAAYLDLEPEDRVVLETSGMSFLRFHSLIKTGMSTYDLAQLTNPGGLSNVSRGSTLTQSLEITRSAGINPWLQIEPHLSAAEWLGLAEYLAAPFDPARDDPGTLPWAAKRHAQGMTAPWADQFDEIYFEIGNETWNRLFSPWTFTDMTDTVTGRNYKRGEVYGLYQEYVLGILRQSPWWDRIAPKFSAVIGGWAINDYGVDAMRMSPHSRFLTHAAYNGGWDEDERLLSQKIESYASVLHQSLQSGIPRAVQRREDGLKLSRDRDLPAEIGTYEAGPGYVNRAPGNKPLDPEAEEQQERVMKSAAAGTATLDAFLARAEYGYTVQNYFTFGSGRFWTSHARWERGGQSFPGWDLLAAFNREAIGDVLAVETIDVPTIDLPEAKRRAEVRDGPLVEVYATRNGDRLSVIALSRRVPDVPKAGDDGRTRLRIRLPIDSAESLVRIDQTGRFDSHNVDGKEVRLTETELQAPATLPEIEIESLDPGKTVFLIFDGVRWSDG